MDLINIIASLIALIILEIVLGIDNLVMLSLLTDKLPVHKRKKARKWGLTFSWVSRLVLLAFSVSIIKLTQPLITIAGLPLSIRDCFLLFGGLFLIWKATDELHQDVTNEPLAAPSHKKKYSAATFRAVVCQVALIDIIFSLDSVLTAVGLTSLFWVMALAITCAILIMLYASEVVSNLISTHPTIKTLALSYLILIGMVLIADGLSFHIPRGYVYCAMGFSLAVESLNLFKSSRRKS
jgi:predicted tellurium resistance membrane protein TerC